MVPPKEPIAEDKRSVETKRLMARYQTAIPELADYHTRSLEEQDQALTRLGKQMQSPATLRMEDGSTLAELKTATEAGVQGLKDHVQQIYRNDIPPDEANMVALKNRVSQIGTALPQQVESDRAALTSEMERIAFPRDKMAEALGQPPNLEPDLQGFKQMDAEVDAQIGNVQKYIRVSQDLRSLSEMPQAQREGAFKNMGEVLPKLPVERRLGMLNGVAKDGRDTIIALGESVRKQEISGTTGVNKSEQVVEGITQFRRLADLKEETPELKAALKPVEEAMVNKDVQGMYFARMVDAHNENQKIASGIKADKFGAFATDWASSDYTNMVNQGNKTSQALKTMGQSIVKSEYNTPQKFYDAYSAAAANVNETAQLGGVYRDGANARNDNSKLVVKTTREFLAARVAGPLGSGLVASAVDLADGKDLRTATIDGASTSLSVLVGGKVFKGAGPTFSRALGPKAGTVLAGVAAGSSAGVSGDLAYQGLDIATDTPAAGQKPKELNLTQTAVAGITGGIAGGVLSVKNIPFGKTPPPTGGVPTIPTTPVSPTSPVNSLIELPTGGAARVPVGTQSMNPGPVVGSRGATTNTVPILQLGPQATIPVRTDATTPGGLPFLGSRPGPVRIGDPEVRGVSSPDPRPSPIIPNPNPIPRLNDVPRLQPTDVPVRPIPYNPFSPFTPANQPNTRLPASPFTLPFPNKAEIEPPQGPKYEPPQDPLETARRATVEKAEGDRVETKGVSDGNPTSTPPIVPNGEAIAQDISPTDTKTEQPPANNAPKKPLDDGDIPEDKLVQAFEDANYGEDDIWKRMLEREAIYNAVSVSRTRAAAITALREQEIDATKDPYALKEMEKRGAADKSYGVAAGSSAPSPVLVRGARLEKPQAEAKLKELGGTVVPRTDLQELSPSGSSANLPKGVVFTLPTDKAQQIKEAILANPDTPDAIKEVIRGFGAKSFLFTYDLDGHGSPGSGQSATTYKIFGVSGKTSYRLGSYDSDFRYARN